MQQRRRLLKAKPAAAGRPSAKRDVAKRAVSAFSTRKLIDPDTGWEIVVLRFRDPRVSGGGLEARLAPAVGANLFSLVLDGQELLHQPDQLSDLTHHRAGTPVLFPTPNRVRDAAMIHGGRHFTFAPNSERNFIHGLVRDRPWQIAKRETTDRSAKVELTLDWNADQPPFASFPIAHQLSLLFELRRSGLRIAYRVINQDATPLPYGFGLHPFFRIPGARSAVRIQVPLAHRMEATERLPTGKLIAVAGTPYDLRRPTALTDLALDDVYFGMTPAKSAGFELLEEGSRGVRMTLAGSPAFTHLVIYTPPNRPFFCLENQTSSTDAHNLWARGQRRTSNLLVVPPGKTGRGHVDWKIFRGA